MTIIVTIETAGNKTAAGLHSEGAPVNDTEQRLAVLVQAAVAAALELYGQTFYTGYEGVTGTGDGVAAIIEKMRAKHGFQTPPPEES